MHILSRIGTVLFYSLVILIIFAILGAAFNSTPYFFSVIRSYSMSPYLTKGDLVFTQPLFFSPTLEIGNIILFKTVDDSFSAEGWIMHRIVDGNSETGFITKGDANEEADQIRGKAHPVKKEWIAAKALTWKGHVLKCPYIGHLSLLTEKYQKSPWLLPSMALVLTIVLIATELPSHKRKRKKNKDDQPLVYLGSGLIISILLFAGMLASSQKIPLVYNVADQQGVLQGSTIGILQEGTTTQHHLTQLTNKSFFPFIIITTSPDSQISFNHHYLTLKQNETRGLDYKIAALQKGSYQVPVIINMYYPFLPPKVLYSLQQKSIWLALIVVALLPALPLLIYPFIEPTMRRKIKKRVRHFSRRIKKLYPLK